MLLVGSGQGEQGGESDLKEITSATGCQVVQVLEAGVLSVFQYFDSPYLELPYFEFQDF